MAEIDRAIDLIDEFLTVLDEIADGPSKEHCMLSKKQILAAPDIKCEEVNIPEWGGSVMVYGMTGSQRDEFEASIVEMKGGTQTMHLEGIRAKLCSLTIRDEDGRRMFDSDEVDELGAKSAQALQRIFEVAQRLSGLTPADVEGLAKNLESGANAGSGSVSL